MKLSELLNTYPSAIADIDILDIKLDSRDLNPQELFCAIPGATTDGRKYIKAAFAKGAAAVLYEPEPYFEGIEQLHDQYQEKLIAFPDLKQQLGWIARRLYQSPTQKLQVIAVTGTNGKTSSCYLLTHFLRLLREPCGMIGTIGHGFNHALVESFNTTPDAVTLQRLFKQFNDQGCRYAVMEASSHGLDQGRMNGTDVRIALFTNLTRDHLDYHPSMQHYQLAKQKLFEFPNLAVAVVNADDPFGRHILSILPAHVKKYAYSIQPESFPNVDPACLCLHAQEIQLKPHGMHASIRTPWGQQRITTNLLGEFNLSNLLGVIATLGELGFSLTAISELVKNPPPIPGRMQRFGEAGQPTVVVDYAHTPDALRQLLITLRAHCQGKLKLVFGCGGDRDRGKRSQMGEIASQYSDHIVLTSDNPRTEEPQKIIEDILVGIDPHYAGTTEIESNRKHAIARIIQSADLTDIVVIAGKGHEHYQEIGTERLAFNDADEVKHALRMYQDKKITV